MSPLRKAAVAAWLAVLAASVDADDWRAATPDDWLVAVEIRDLGTLEARLADLLKPWGRKAPPVAELLDRVTPGAGFADRPWLVFLFEDPSGIVAPSLLAPAEDFAELCTAFDADVADDLAVASLAGFDLALRDRGGWTEVTLLDSVPTIARVPSTDDATAVPRVDHELAIHVSPLGLRAAAQRLETRRLAELRRRKRLVRLAWPKSLSEATQQLAAFAPMAKHLAESPAPLTIGFDFDTDNDPGASEGPDAATDAFLATLTLPDRAATTSSNAGPAVSSNADAIATLASSGPLPAPVVDLLLAAAQCRPDDIDAREYAQPQWDDFAQATRRLLAGCRSIRTTLSTPRGDEPLAANQTAVFRWAGDAAELGDALAMAVVRWNLLIEASRARTPLRVAIEPLAETPGWRLSVDLIAGFAVPRSPEVEAIFDRFYGGDTLTVDVTPTDEDAWSVSMGPAPDAETPKLAFTSNAEQSATRLQGRLHFDRLWAWGQRFEDAAMAETFGRKARPPMAVAPPAELTVTDTVRLRARLPRATYEAAVDYWRSKKQRLPRE